MVFNESIRRQARGDVKPHEHDGGDISGELIATGLRPSAVIGLATWETFTPTWTSSVSPVLGNGTIAGRFLQIDKLVIVVGYLTPGSTTTFGSGLYRLGLPVTRVAQTDAVRGFDFTQSASIYDNSAVLLYTMHSERVGTKSILLSRHADGVAPSNWDATTPITLAQDDKVRWMLMYEAE